jgi:hypothetical protein
MKEKHPNYDPKTQYWCALPLEDFASVALEKISNYYESLSTSGIIELWQTMYNMYYGLSEGSSRHESHEIHFIGDNDEGVKIRSGHMANVAQHILISATGQEPNYIARAVNSDVKSQYQTYAAKSVLEYYMKEKDYSLAMEEAAEISLIMSRGYVYIGWDIITNEAFAYAHSPLTIITDLNNIRYRHPLWYIVVERTNKWDVVAKYNIPEDEIEDALDSELFGNDYFHGFDRLIDCDDDGDYINVYHFYHDKTPALPDGRYVAFTNQDYTLYPSKGSKEDMLPYEDLPIEFVEPRRMVLSPHSYTGLFDVAVHEKVHNVALSTVHSMLNKYGKKVIYGPKNPSYEDIGGTEYIGLEADDRPPGILDMTDISQSLIKLIELERGEIETLSGVNAAIRGDTGGQKSGSHAALLHAVAVEFQAGFNKSYSKLLERCGTKLLRLLKEYFEEETMIQIVGKDGEPYLKAFTSDDISEIDRVVVENGPTALSTMAGKLHFGDLMVERGIVKSPDEYQEIVDTGQLQSALTPRRNKNAGLQAENELLMNPEQITLEVERDSMGQPVIGPDGQPNEYLVEVPALIIDDHPMHIAEHGALMLQPSYRQDQELLRKTRIHIEHHIRLWEKMPPALAVALGVAPFPRQAPMGPRPGVPRPPGNVKPPIPPPGPGAPPSGSGGGVQLPPGAQVPEPTKPLPGMPKMPANPTQEM